MRKIWIAALSTTMSFALIGGTAMLSSASAEDAVVYTEVAKYTFADSENLGKDTSGKENHLTAIGNPTQAKEADGSTAVRFDGESVLYAAGDSNGYDYADYLLDEEFTLSLSFYVSSDIPDGVTFDGRNAIFTVWGFQYNGVNDYNSSSSAANYSTSALMFDSYTDGASSVNLRYGVATQTRGDGSDYNPYWEETETSVSTDTWHTASFTWDPVTRKTVISIDDQSWTETARADNTFRSNKARFTLGGYYNEGAGGLKNAGATKTINMVGMIKNVTVSTVQTAGNGYTELVSYDFASQDKLGKANVSAYDLVEWKADANGASATYDADKDALFSPVNSVLVPKGYARQWYDTHDFMDYLAGKSFTVSTSFMLPSVCQTKADGRGAIFSLWGLWSGNSFGGAAAADLVSSSVVYDAYDSGAEKANIRIGFLYDNGDNTENGWWSNKEGQVTTDEFHTLTISVDNLSIAVYIDGARFASFTASEKNEWGRTETSFAIGGAAGYGGVSNNSGEAYFKYFNIYDFAMAESEMSKLASERLEKVSAAYITEASPADGDCTVSYGATDEEILEAAPVGTQITVTLSDEKAVTATALWTGVERDGMDIYLVGEIIGAGASNLLGVQAKMSVVEERIESVEPAVEWTFGEKVTSSKGGIYELTSVKGSVYTTENGILDLNGDALLAEKDENGYDFMDYSSDGDFSVFLSFRLPEGIEQNHVFALTLFGENYEKAGAIVLNNYGATSATTTLRVGFAYDSKNESEGSNGTHGSSYWTKYNASVKIGSWNGLAISYNAESETITVYLNGAEVCSYAVSGTRNWKNADGGFMLGSLNAKNQISYKALKFYDYAVGAENLAILSKAGSMPVAAGETAATRAVASVASSASLKVAGELTAETALREMQKSGKMVRVNLADDDMLTASVNWTTATPNGDGTYTVSGEILGLHNPENVKATATVSLATYKVAFDATNAVVKMDGSAVTEVAAAYGSSLSFTVEASEGYEIVSVKVGAIVLTENNGSYIVENVTADTSVTIETKKAEAPVDSSSGSGTSSASDSDSAVSSTSEGNVKTKGCGSVGGTIGIGFAAIATAALVAKRKKSED